MNSIAAATHAVFDFMRRSIVLVIAIAIAIAVYGGPPASPDEGPASHPVPAVVDGDGHRTPFAVEIAEECGTTRLVLHDAAGTELLELDYLKTGRTPASRHEIIKASVWQKADGAASVSVVSRETRVHVNSQADGAATIVVGGIGPGDPRHGEIRVPPGD
jgi:hypothetical protein